MGFHSIGGSSTGLFAEFALGQGRPPRKRTADCRRLPMVGINRYMYWGLDRLGWPPP